MTNNDRDVMDYLKQYPVKGCRFNVVRRPLSGGKGTIKQTKNESITEYYARLKQYIENEPETYFMRWTAEVAPSDIERFKKQTLDPILEQLCLWYDYTTTGAVGNVRADCMHWRHPYGADNSVDSFGASDVDGYLETGNTVGLTRTTEMFPELK